MKKITYLLLFLPSLYSFNTQGSYWSSKEVYIYPDLQNELHNLWVYTVGIETWRDSNNHLGPANVDFWLAGYPGTGIVEVIRDPRPKPNVPGKTGIQISPLGCKNIYDGKIYINYQHYNWTPNQGKFASVIRHEIGHAAGLEHSEDPNAIMYPYFNPIPAYKQISQDDINGLGCLYGGDFNWGNETFTLIRPKSGEEDTCFIPVAFGGCNGQGSTYDVSIYVKYDADIPNSPWIFLGSFQDVRGCLKEFYGRKQSSQSTQVKVEWYSGGVLKDTKISGFFTYIWNPVKCPEIAPPDYQASGCGCKSLNILEGPIPHNFQKIEVFDITGRRILFADKDSRELFINALNDLPEGIYFIRIIKKEKIYVKKVVLRENN